MYLHRRVQEFDPVMGKFVVMVVLWLKDRTCMHCMVSLLMVVMDVNSVVWYAANTMHTLHSFCMFASCTDVDKVVDSFLL
jgi:hypothetical protein